MSHVNYRYHNPATHASFQLAVTCPNVGKNFYTDRSEPHLAIVWNRGMEQQVVIDEIRYTFPRDHFLALMVHQSYRFEHPEDVVLWQFNREFYCIVDHDSEVGCTGLLFYGWSGVQFLSATEEDIRKYTLLLRVFLDEFHENDGIQEEMLRMLLKRLIIKLTRLAKAQVIHGNIQSEELDLIRRFNLLVEGHFREKHQVQDYAALLHRSPKTLSNLFSKYHEKTPLQVIRERIALEARRLLTYTDKSVAEVGYELGFEEASHFSRFFKKVVGVSPSKMGAGV